jgi:hypothetical protein
MYLMIIYGFARLSLYGVPRFLPFKDALELVSSTLISGFINHQRC